MKAVIIILLAVGAFAVYFSMLKSKHFFKSLINSAFQGLASLLAVNVIGLLTGVTVALNWYTIAFSCVFGTPACIALLFLDTLFR